MAIHVEINEVSNIDKFPCLRKSRRSGLVVLFTAYQEGIVLVGTHEYEVGHKSDDWIEFSNENNWEIVNSLTIINV